MYPPIQKSFAPSKGPAFSTVACQLTAAAERHRAVQYLAATLGCLSIPLSIPEAGGRSQIAAQPGRILIAVDSRVPGSRGKIAPLGRSPVTLDLPVSAPEPDKQLQDALAECSRFFGFPMMLLYPGSQRGRIKLPWYWAVYALNPRPPESNSGPHAPKLCGGVLPVDDDERRTAVQRSWMPVVRNTFTKNHKPANQNFFLEAA